MSQPLPGNYFIVNADIFSSGPLALNYNGVGSAVTVVGLNEVLTDPTSLNQVWTVGGLSATMQTISPYNDASLQVSLGDGVLITVPGSLYAWTVGGFLDVYTIRDTAKTLFWDLAVAADDQAVSFDSAPNSPTQYWQFIPAIVEL